MRENAQQPVYLNWPQYLQQVEKISSSLDMTFPFSTGLTFSLFDLFSVKWLKMAFQNVLLSVIFFVSNLNGLLNQSILSCAEGQKWSSFVS